MASNYTSQYGLCQWAADDSVLRTEFNDDNQKIEAALTGLKSQIDAQVETRLAAIEAQLPSLQGNVYDLMLKQYYDGTDLGSRKMLFLDGVKDQALIASTTPGLWYDPAAKRPRLYAAGARSVTSSFTVEAGGTTNTDSDNNQCAWVGHDTVTFTADSPFTPSGFGVLKSVSMRLCKKLSITDNITARVYILDGSQVLATSQTVSVTGTTYADHTFTFSSGVTLSPKEYTLRIENVNHVLYLRVARTEPYSSVLGTAFTYTALNYTSGTLTSVETDLGRDYTGALAWVRHVDGAADLAVKGKTGAFVSMKKLSTRTTTTLRGESCIETAFQLTAPPAAPNRQMTARVTLNAGQTGCALCDYGITFF